jgi:putative flippase GtrA
MRIDMTFLFLCFVWDLWTKVSIFIESVQSLVSRLFKIKIINYGFVGGIGYLVNMGVYYPLTLLFKQEVSFLGQHFYLPPFIISSLVAILCNYHLNKIWTFKKNKEKQLGILRYISSNLVTVMIDMVILFLLVSFGHLTPIISAGIAILLVFIMRYFIATHWIWNK